GTVEIAARKMREQTGDTVLDQMDARRFEGFEEARGKAQRDDIAAPGPAAHSRPETQRPRFGERPAFDVGEQHRGRLVLADEVAAKDVAVSRAVLERDAPLPAALVRDCLCIGPRWASIFAGHRNRAVAGKPMRPVLKAGLESVPDQQRAKARAVDEKLAVDRGSVFEDDRFDMAA